MESRLCLEKMGPQRFCHGRRDRAGASPREGRNGRQPKDARRKGRAAAPATAAGCGVHGLPGAGARAPGPEADTRRKGRAAWPKAGGRCAAQGGGPPGRGTGADTRRRGLGRGPVRGAGGGTPGRGHVAARGRRTGPRGAGARRPPGAPERNGAARDDAPPRPPRARRGEGHSHGTLARRARPPGRAGARPGLRASPGPAPAHTSPASACR